MAAKPIVSEENALDTSAKLFTAATKLKSSGLLPWGKMGVPNDVYVGTGKIKEADYSCQLAKTHNNYNRDVLRDVSANLDNMQQLPQRL